jgi:Bacterial Ig-like domain (group 2)
MMTSPARNQISSTLELGFWRYSMNTSTLTLRFVGFIGLMTMASCSTALPNGAPTAAVGRISITGAPSLKLGTPITLKATGFDANGQGLTGKTFLWTSSNPSVAVIDQRSGVVTAKRFGTVAIDATSEGVTSTQTFQTYGLEASGGTQNGNGLIGTSLVVRARAANVQEIATVNLSVTGPNGWNGNTPFEMSATGCKNPLGIAQGFSAIAKVVPVSGTYTATANLNGETVTRQFVVDATQLLPGLTISSAKFQPGKAPGTFYLSSNWDVVPGANSYLLKVSGGDATTTFEEITANAGPNRTSMDFQPSAMQVFGFSADMRGVCTDTFELPAQVNTTAGNSLVTAL